VRTLLLWTLVRGRMPRLPLPFLATQFIAPESIFVAVVAGHKVSPTVCACECVCV